MTSHLPSIALTTAVAGLTYSGIQGMRDTSGQKSKCREMAKVALGVALCAGGIAYYSGGEWIDRKVFRIAKQSFENDNPALGTVLL